MNGGFQRKVNKNTQRFQSKKERRMQRRKAWCGRPLRRFLLVLCCLLLAVYGGIKLIAYRVDSRAAQLANAELQAIYDSSATVSAIPETLSTASPASVAPSAAPATSAQDTALPVQTTLPATATDGMKQEFQLCDGEMLPAMAKLYEKNKDVIGWLRITGVVDLPVVYRDNSYYLTHDFSGKKSSSGTLFLDELHPLTPGTQSLVIHGHNMLDGSMFGLLGHYRKAEYVREHGLVTFSTLYREETYAVFAVLVTPDDVNAQGYVAYSGTPAFDTTARFDDFLREIRQYSLFYVPIDVASTDALLTLSTCQDEGHLIVVCRRLREDETRGWALGQLRLTRD